MRIKIKSQGKSFTIAFPTAWVFSRMGLYFLKKHNESEFLSEIKPRSVRTIRKMVRKMRKLHKNWNLVEVDSADGTGVKIRM